MSDTDNTDTAATAQQAAENVDAWISGDPAKMEWASRPGQRKHLGGSQYDAWNDRLSNLVASAVPVNLKNLEEVQASSVAIFSGMIDINSTDPIEAMLVGQLIAANEASLAMYRKGWSQRPEYFQARTK